MRMTASLAIVLLTLASGLTAAQRRGTAPTTGPVTFAINVTDSSGAPVPDVRVTLSGVVTRTTRTERGRTVFENLPSGQYILKFEKPGYISVDRQVTGRGAKPIEVAVTMEREPEPEPAPVEKPAAPPPPPPDLKMAVLDMPAFIEKNYIGRAAGKTTPMGCAPGGSSTLIQMNEPLAQHTHDDADEFIYVIAGQGMAKLSGREEPLGPAVFLMVPRGMPHTVAAGPKKPLVLMSVLAGDKCR
ncbi:MAG TPA: carboxypeptidase regulatory-like domain-containing protein [Vicinamibacterales bacterium]|nr:carboxypeptidase regulatory-like domain-containing protein [Vicinamibacterales bacterium]